MSHDEIRSRLLEIAELDSLENLPASSQEHLKACPACSALVAERRQVVALMQDLPLLEPPDDLADRIFALSERERAVRIEPVRRSLLKRPWLVAGPLVAAAAVLVAVVLNQERGSVEPPPAAEQRSVRLKLVPETPESREAFERQFGGSILGHALKRVTGG